MEQILHPMQKDDAMYRGNSHKNGGIDVVVDGEKPIEVEGYEYKICRGAYNSPDKISRTGTNKEILDFIHGEFSCNFEQPKADSGDFILCKLVVLDTATKKREGTVRQILDEMQAEKNCRISNQNQQTMQTLEKGGQANVEAIVNTTEDVAPDKIKQAIEKVASTREWFNHLLTKFIPSIKRVAPANSTVYARTKTTQSILNKLVDKRMIDAECPKKGLTDLIGFTIAVNSLDELKEVRKDIEGGALGEVVETEDMYQTPKGGYRAIHFILWLKTEKGRIPVELQLKTRRMKSLNELSHEPYKRKALNTERMNELASLALKADAGDYAAQSKWKEVISDEAGVEKSLYKKEYAAGGELVEISTTQEPTEIKISRSGLPRIIGKDITPEATGIRMSIFEWLKSFGVSELRIGILQTIYVEYKGREFFVEFAQRGVLVKGSFDGKPSFIIPTSQQSGIVVSGKKMKMVSSEYADTTKILAEAIVHAFDRAIQEKQETELSEELIAADLPIPATYEMNFRQPQILETSLVDELRNNGASHIIPSGELNGLYFSYLGKRFFVFDNEFEFKLDCLNPSVYIDQIDKGSSAKDTATDIIIAASNFHNNPHSFTAEIEPREEGADATGDYPADQIIEGTISNGLRSHIWQAIHHAKTADEKFALGGGVEKEISQEDFEEWLGVPHKRKIKVHGSPLAGFGDGVTYGIVTQNDEVAWFVPLFPNGDLNFMETGLPQYKSDLLVAVNNFLSGKPNGIELLPDNAESTKDESDKHYTKAVYVPKHEADKFKLQLTKAGLAWDSFGESERFDNIAFGFTASQMEKIKNFVNEYAVEITEYADGGLIPHRGAETKFGKVISAFRQPLAVRSVTIKGMNDAALDKFIDNCMASYVDTIQVGNNRVFIVGDTIEEIARKTDRHIPAGQQVTDYRVAYAITDKDVVISEDDIIGEDEEFARGGLVPAIIKTKTDAFLFWNAKEKANPMCYNTLTFGQEVGKLIEDARASDSFKDVNDTTLKEWATTYNTSEKRQPLLRELAPKITFVGGTYKGRRLHIYATKENRKEVLSLLKKLGYKVQVGDILGEGFEWYRKVIVLGNEFSKDSIKEARELAFEILGSALDSDYQGYPTDEKTIRGKISKYLPKDILKSQIESQLYKSGGEVTIEKAKQILTDGTAHGHPLTAAQKRYFGWIAGGRKKYSNGGNIGWVAKDLLGGLTVSEIKNNHAEAIAKIKAASVDRNDLEEAIKYRIKNTPIAERSQYIKSLKVGDTIIIDGFQGIEFETVYLLDKGLDIVYIKERDADDAPYAEPLSPKDIFVPFPKGYESGGALEESVEIMEDDCAITSNGWKYSVSCGGKFIKECEEMDEALEAVVNWKDENKWYPNTWFISDHGNASLIDDEGNIIRYADGGMVRDENGEEFDIYNLSERQINKRLSELGWTRSELNDYAPESKRMALKEAYDLAGFASGGIVSFVKPEASHKKTWYSRGTRDGRECIGSFDLKTHKNWTEFYLYNISEFDEDYYRHIKLKPVEKLYRYETDTTKISGLFPIIKINRENGLVYFLADLYADDDKNLVFQSRGLKPLWLSLSESEKFSFGGLLPLAEYAKGGEIKKWVGRDFESSSGKTQEFMDFAKDFKKAIVKNMEGYDLINFSKGHFYLSGFFKNKTNGNLVYFSTSDVREGGRSSWNDHLLIRTAKSEKDYTGGGNNYTTFDGIKATADKLTTKTKVESTQTNTPSIQTKTRDLNEVEHEAMATAFANNKPNLSASSYKNAYELNKAIERLIDQKNSDKPEDYTAEEKQFISLYSGMGGLEKHGATGKGLLWEYFTPDAIVQKMWALAYKNGFKGGSVLEPSVGVGAFIKYAGENCNVEGFEINKYSYTICRVLFPSAKIYHQAFEQRFIANNDTVKRDVFFSSKYPQTGFDLVIGNPPYGDFTGKWAGMGEQSFTKAQSYVEYFITRGLDLTVSGGLLIYIVGVEVANGGKPFLAQGMTKAKEAIAEKAELLEAYRLPNGVFDRTDVVTDIIVLRKK